MHIIKKSFFTLAFACIASSIAFSQSADYKTTFSLLTGKWKKVKFEENGEEKDPLHEKVVIEFNGNKRKFIIVNEYHETHAGTWTLSPDAKSVILNDDSTKKTLTLEIKEIDKDHLVIQHYNNPNGYIHMAPLKNSKAMHLNHKEHLLAKTWHIYKSDKEDNVGLEFQFKHDKTYAIIPPGFKLPVATGNWKLSDDKTRLIMDKREDGEHLELEIISISRHELVLKNLLSGVVNYLHDNEMVSRDEKKSGKKVATETAPVAE